MKIKGSKTNTRFSELNPGDVFTGKGTNGYVMKISSAHELAEPNAVYLANGELTTLNSDAHCRLFPLATLCPDGTGERHEVTDSSQVATTEEGS